MVDELRAIVADEMKLAGLKRLNSGWILDFEEIAWIYNLTKDRYGNRFAIMVGIEIKEMEESSRVKNFNGCSIFSDLSGFQSATGISRIELLSLFRLDSGNNIDDLEREGRIRRVISGAAAWSRQHPNLLEVKKLYRKGAFAGAMIEKNARSLLEMMD